MSKCSLSFARRGALAGLVSLCVAGTCLAAPGLASATEAPAATDDVAATEGAASDSQTVSFGGIQVSVPSDFVALAIEDAMVTSTSPNGAVSVSIINAVADGVPTEASELEAYFNDVAQQGAAAVGGTVANAAQGMVGDTTAYLYGVDLSAAQPPSALAIVYIPQADGTLTVVECIADLSDESNSAIADAIVNSLAPADEAAAKTDAAAQTVALDQTVEIAGITMGLPGDFTAIDEETWANADETFLVGVGAGAAEDAGAITAADLDEVAATLAQELGGSVLNSTVLANGETSVYLYALVIADETDAYTGVIGFVPVADGSLSFVYGICSAADTEALAPTLDAIYGSITATA